MTGGRPWYAALYVQVLIAVLLGAVVGWLFPVFATNPWIEFLGRAFVKLGQDGDRADHLLHRRFGHRANQGSQKRRPRSA